MVRQTISKWEQGLSVPDSEMLISISEVLETPVSNLLGKNMKTSVERNKGFYIARYEAGIPGTTTSNPENHNTIMDGTTIPVSKKGVGVWNWIKWGTNNNTANPGNGAVTVARSMYKNHESVVSTLCYDIQWDTALEFIQNAKKEYNNYPTDSTGKGNYLPRALAITGSNETYKVCNIYDMSGNTYEWTMASYSDGHYINRGGNCNVSGINDPAGSRYNYYYNYGNSGFGFRVALYMK